jgi:hypothetical protein
MRVRVAAVLQESGSDTGLFPMYMDLKTIQELNTGSRPAPGFQP